MSYREAGTAIKVKLNGCVYDVALLDAVDGGVYDAIIRSENQRGILAWLVVQESHILVDHESKCAYLESGEWNEVKE